MAKIRFVLWTLVALALIGLGYFVLQNNKPIQVATTFNAHFALEKTDGTKFTDKDMLGRPHLVFFGFTHCPEICPTTLYETSGWIEEIGDSAKNLDVYFITVDPEQDTKEVLGNYLSPFNGVVTGLTGSVEEMDKVAKGYHVYYKKVPLDDGGYTMDHTASIFLMKADGSFMGTIAWGENSEIAIKKIKRLLAN